MRGSKKQKPKSESGPANAGESSESPSAAPAPAWQKKLPFVLTAIFFALLFACVPRLPLTADGDDNWAAVLVHAHEKNFQFGTGVAVTYGPLGFLTIQYFAGASMGLRLFFDGVVAAGIATCLCFLAWRMKLPWRIGLFAVILLLPGHLFNNGMDILFNLGVISCGFLCFGETGPRLKYYVVALVTLAVICVLSKFTLLASAGATLGFVACDLFLRRQRVLAIATPVGFVFAFSLLWLLLGQSLGNLPDYIVNAMAISSGYNDAMAQPPPEAVGNGMLVVALFIVATVLIRCFIRDRSADKVVKLRYGLLGLWLMSQLFVDWKHSIVRSGEGDAHIMLFLTIAPVVALLFETIPFGTELRCRAARVAAVATCLTALIVSPITFKADPEKRGGYEARLKHVFQRVPENLGTFFAPGAYIKSMSATNEAARARVQVPKTKQIVGNAPVDIFGWHSAIPIFNGMNYQPRPVFQSYQAYHPTLINANDQFYYTKAAPEYVMFLYDHIDNRFPPLADSRLIVTLLANYQPVDGEGGIMLLRRRPEVTPPKMSLLSEGSVQWSEPIDLQRFSTTNLWMEVDVQPSMQGKLHQFLFRPVYPQLGLWTGDRKKVVEFRAPRLMLGAGFLANPVVFGPQDFVNASEGKPMQRVAGYSVEVSSAEKKYWSDQVRYRIYQIETPFTAKKM